MFRFFIFCCGCFVVTASAIVVQNDSAATNAPAGFSSGIPVSFAQRYGLNMQSVHWEPDAEPDAVMWQELEDILETHPAKIMLWEDEPRPSVKTALAERASTASSLTPAGTGLLRMILCLSCRRIWRHWVIFNPVNRPLTSSPGSAYYLPRFFAECPVGIFA